jgi:4'-phosphopantetheinyl transferase EntD
VEIIVQNDILTLAVHPIQPEEFYRDYLQNKEISRKIMTFSNVHRRREWLNTHYLIHQLVHQITTYSYDDSGKPVIPEKNIELSITHSEHYSAIAVSKTHRLGIDMEEDHRSFIKASKKFLHPSETEWAAGKNELLRAIWCAKESIYKLLIPAVPNFSTDYQTIPFVLKRSGEMMINLTFPSTSKIEVNYMQNENYFVTWCSKKSEK